MKEGVSGEIVNKSRLVDGVACGRGEGGGVCGSPLGGGSSC